MLRILPGRSGGRAGSVVGAGASSAEGSAPLHRSTSELRLDVASGEQPLPSRTLRLRVAALLALFLFMLALVSFSGAVGPRPTPQPKVQAASADSAVAAAAAAIIDIAARAEAMLHKEAEGELSSGGGGDGGPDWDWSPEEAASWTELKAAALSAEEAPEPEPEGGGAAAAAPPAIAFLFLTRGQLPHAHLWERFLRAAPDPRSWRIHAHAPPGVRLEEATVPGSPLFHGAELRNGTASVRVVWGELSVVDAERRLLAAALADPAVQRLVLLSESCVPLRSFAFVQRYLLSSPESYVDSFEDSVNSRYHPAFAAEGVPEERWRKGSQWASLTRADALLLISDTLVFSAFQRVQIFAPDEHYKQTVLSLAAARPIQPRPVTYANWWPDTRAHPKLHVVQETTAALVADLRERREFFRPAEGEHVRCSGPTEAPWLGPEEGREVGAGAPCWLFARKFTEKAGGKLAELIDWEAAAAQ